MPYDVDFILSCQHERVINDAVNMRADLYSNYHRAINKCADNYHRYAHHDREVMRAAFRREVSFQVLRNHYCGDATAGEALGVLAYLRFDTLGAATLFKLSHDSSDPPHAVRLTFPIPTWMLCTGADEVCGENDCFRLNQCLYGRLEEMFGVPIYDVGFPTSPLETFRTPALHAFCGIPDPAVVDLHSHQTVIRCVQLLTSTMSEAVRLREMAQHAYRVNAARMPKRWKNALVEKGVLRRMVGRADLPRLDLPAGDFWTFFDDISRDFRTASRSSRRTL